MAAPGRYSQRMLGCLGPLRSPLMWVLVVLQLTAAATYTNGSRYAIAGHAPFQAVASGAAGQDKAVVTGPVGMVPGRVFRTHKHSGRCPANGLARRFRAAERLQGRSTHEPQVELPLVQYRPGTLLNAAGHHHGHRRINRLSADEPGWPGDSLPAPATIQRQVAGKQGGLAWPLLVFVVTSLAFGFYVRRNFELAPAGKPRRLEQSKDRLGHRFRRPQPGIILDGLLTAAVTNGASPTAPGS